MSQSLTLVYSTVKRIFIIIIIQHYCYCHEDDDLIRVITIMHAVVHFHHVERGDKIRTGYYYSYYIIILFSMPHDCYYQCIEPIC